MQFCAGPRAPRSWANGVSGGKFKIYILSFVDPKSEKSAPTLPADLFGVIVHFT